MKIKRILSVATILMLSFLILVSLSFAQKPEKQEKRAKTGLELTPEQKDKIMETRLNFQKDKIKLKADMKIAQLELKSLMREEELNKTEIYKKIEYLGNLKTQLAKYRVDQRMAIRGILTKEQLDKLKERKFRRPLGRRFMQHRDRQHKPFRQGQGFMERPRQQGGMGMLAPEAELAPPVEAEEFFFEPAELAQIIEEMKLTPLLEEELPPMPEEPEMEP